MDGDRDTETVDGDDSELSISVSVGDVSVEVSGRADKVEFWYDVVKNDVLEPLDEETIRAAAESGGPPVATSPVRNETAEENGAQASGSTTDTDDSTEESVPERTLPEYYDMAGGDDLTKKDRALLVGWFFTQHGDEQFTKAKVADKAEDAQIELGSNVPRDLRYQVADSHMSKVGESEGSPVYQLTRTGEDYVEEELFATEE
jgi:hypothetical protein